MDQDERMRIKWVELFEKTGNSGLMCLRCGIADPHSENEGSRHKIPACKAPLRHPWKVPPQTPRAPRRSPQNE